MQCGIIEVVPNSTSRDQLGKKVEVSAHALSLCAPFDFCLLYSKLLGQFSFYFALIFFFFFICLMSLLLAGHAVRILSGQIRSDQLHRVPEGAQELHSEHGRLQCGHLFAADQGPTQRYVRTHAHAHLYPHAYIQISTDTMVCMLTFTLACTHKTPLSKPRTNTMVCIHSQSRTAILAHLAPALGESWCCKGF